MKNMITKNCIYCGKEYQRPLCEAKRTNMKFCSTGCGVAFRNKANKKEPIELFYKNTLIPENKDECWLWQPNKKARYGVIKINGKPKLVHRFSYEYFCDGIPEGMLICHHCDTPKCVNPKHLFLGTSQDNINDMISKNREKYAFGENQGHSKLTEQDVKEIKLRLQNGENQRLLGLEYNVKQTCIHKIKHGITWRHVTI